MADTLKVFRNQTNQTETTSLSSIPISLATTDSTKQAVIKSVSVDVRNANADYLTAYKYPSKLKVNGATIATSTSSSGLAFTGSLILDASTTLNLEIQPETQAIDYGTMRIMAPNSDGNNTYYEQSIATDPSGEGVTLLGKANSGRTVIGAQVNAYTATGFFKNGVPLVAYADDTATVKILDTSGTLVSTVNVAGAGVRAVAADDTYIYAHGDATTALRRVLISNFTQASTLTLSANFPSFGTSNPGWIDHYNGHIYMRHIGSAGEVYKVNTTTGTNTLIYLGQSPNQTEHLGAIITVNTSGVAYIVEYNDQYWWAYNLDTSTRSAMGYQSAIIGTWQEPTTTSGNHAAAIAPGIVLFRNGNYNQGLIIDVNGTVDASTAPPATVVTTTFPMAGGNTNRLIAGWPQQSGSVLIPRSVEYDVYVSGVEVTI